MFNFYEIILLFFIYAFIGWLFEVILSVFEHHKFINRGFLIGPWLPIYGFGGFIATLGFSKMPIDIEKNLVNIIIIFVSTTVLCSILEYFTSWLMEKLFGNRWWDYSNIKFNLNGRICLLCSLGFGFGCTGALMFLNPFLRTVFDKINLAPRAIYGIDIMLLFLIFIDVMVSFKIINNFKNISNNIVEDSTDKITQMVKKTIINNYNTLYRRLIDAFPNIQINNKLSLLRDRILEEQKKIEKATYKLDRKKLELDKLQKELVKKTNKGIKNKITNLFKKK